MTYRGRLAPTPTGYFHVGHARTFWIAQQRAREHGGTLVLRNEDLDRNRCKSEFVAAMYDDFRWLGLHWSEGPDVGGPFAPYDQSRRHEYYLHVWKLLHATGAIYPSPQSRKELQSALLAPHEGDEEPIFPVELRPALDAGRDASEPGDVNWRFRVQDGRRIEFHDLAAGQVVRTAGVDFGDFVVWRKDGFPSYELAVVGDDHAMEITEIVRGEDLLTSTARQLLLYEALGWQPPRFYQCPLVRDDQGRRLAKRSGSVAIRTLREQGLTPEEVLRMAGAIR